MFVCVVQIYFMCIEKYLILLSSVVIEQPFSVPHYLQQNYQLTLLIYKALGNVMMQFQTVFLREHIILNFIKRSDQYSRHKPLGIVSIPDYNFVLVIQIIFSRTNIMQGHIYYSTLN